MMGTVSLLSRFGFADRKEYTELMGTVSLLSRFFRELDKPDIVPIAAEASA
jgi:hypothetical protein